MNGSMFSQQQYQQQFIPPINYSQNPLGSSNTTSFNMGTMQPNNNNDVSAEVLRAQMAGFETLPNRSVSQASIAVSSGNRQDINQLNTGASDNQYSAVFPNVSGSQNQDDNKNEQTLSKLLSDSSPHCKQMIMESIQKEGKQKGSSR